MNEKKNKIYPDRIIRSKRKTIAIEITKKAELIVRAPARATAFQIQRFLDDKQAWIRAHLKQAKDRIREMEEHPVEKLSDERLRQLIALAKMLLPKRVSLLAKKAGVTYGTIMVRCQKSRWGSCSAKGNLNFNCLLLLAPPDVMDYVIVHELCHRKEMNHSPQFWAEVARIMPDYETHRKWLKENGDRLLAMVERN